MRSPGKIYKYVGPTLTGPVDLNPGVRHYDAGLSPWQLLNGADSSSDDKLTSDLVAGRTVRIATGPGAGDVFQYLGDDGHRHASRTRSTSTARTTGTPRCGSS